MKPIHYRDAVDRAVRDADSSTLSRFATILAECEKAKELLCAKGYGVPGMPIDAIARLVPFVAK